MRYFTILKKLKTRKKSFYLLLFVIAFFVGLIFTIAFPRNDSSLNSKPKLSTINKSATQSPTPTLPTVPSSKSLSNGDYHIFQSFNNCGPASLSMALRFYGINVDQVELGNDLRPFQVPGGDNDDKSVTLEELAEKSKEYGLIPYHRPMGNERLIKQFIAQDLPVITRTWLTTDEDIGHYRVIKGYDESTRTYIQDDSLQNKNLTYTYDEFNEIWKKFNYEYLVLVPSEKKELVERILGENIAEKAAWQKAVDNSLTQLQSNPNDIYARFNLSVAYYNIGSFQKSVEEFEKVENQLPFRTLWYQIEPIKAYYELGEYERVFQITDQVLGYHNRAFSELYMIRGKIYEEQGNLNAARQEYENAVFYNENLEEAKELLNSI